MHAEKELEAAKNHLAGMCDFNCQDAFRVFDLQEHGFFGITQFKEGLGDLGIYVTFDEVELIFKRYDRDADGRLNFKEF